MSESLHIHPRYQEFLAFMVDCPYRKTPETMQTAFWTWCELVRVQEFFNSRLDQKNKQNDDVSLLMLDTINQNTILKAENDALKAMNDALRESNDILKQALNEVSE